MKSIKNHLSLVIALVSILFSIQVFTIVDRAIDAYKQKLANDYSVIVVSQLAIPDYDIKSINKLISEVIELSPDSVIKRLNTEMDQKNIELLKITLPKFYKLKLSHYPSPTEVDRLTKTLLSHKAVTKVENFSSNHNSIFKLLLLLKEIISIFAISIFVVTILLILKELKIWQFMHNERMSIMGLFGAPIWLSSAILFRLAIVDALIASAITFILFKYLASSAWIQHQLDYIDITITVFNAIDDFLILFGVSMFLSVVLALLVIIGHKEEV